MSKTSLLFAAALAGLALAADKVYSPLPEVINVHPDFQYATARILKTHVDGGGKYELILPERPAAGTAAPLPVRDSIVALAQANGCQLYLVQSMTRIGETILLGYELRKVSDGSMVWSDRLKAASPDDLDPISERVAKAMTLGAKATQPGDIYSVTGQEQQTLKQKQSNNTLGLEIGSWFLVGSPFHSDPAVGGFGAVWNYDTRTLLVELNAAFYMMNPTSNAILGGISIYRPVTTGDITPY